MEGLGVKEGEGWKGGGGQECSGEGIERGEEVGE